MHVPLLVWNGETSGRHDEMVGLVDLVPTILEWGGQEEFPESIYGYSLQPLLNGDGTWSREQVRGGWSVDPDGSRPRRLACRTRSWKYVRDGVDGTGRLHDLDADLGEQTNVADEHPDVLAEFRERIDAYEREIDATARETESVEMDEATKNRLRNLGYVE